MKCDMQYTTMLPRKKLQPKDSVWNWHLFLNSLYHFIPSAFEKKFLVNTRIYYFVIFYERFVVFLDWSRTHNWWILMQLYISIGACIGGIFYWCLLKKWKYWIQNSWNEMLSVWKRFNATIINCIWYSLLLFFISTTVKV